MNPSLPALTVGRFFRRRLRRKQGFALVVTLALMVLLSLLAVGLLGLSSVELRTSSRGSAMAQAQANARLALQIAIGELQLHAGPDQRITATSDIIGGNHRYTGVWDSRKLDPNNPNALYASKEQSFRKWLVSNVDSTATENQAFATETVGDSVDLVSQNVVGTTGAIIQAGRVPLKNSNSMEPTGHYAYATIDESVKARVDIGKVIPSNTASLDLKSQALASGQTPGINRITDLTAQGSSNPIELISSQDPNLSKIISLDQADIAYNSSPGSFGVKYHDLTTQSLSIFADVVNGGLKKDFNLLAEFTPSGFAASGIYSSSYANLSVSGEPLWGSAIDFSKIFNTGNLSIGTTPVLKASAPQNWKALNIDPSTGGDRVEINKSAPSGPVLMPSVAKVQVVYSWVTRDIYKHQSTRMAGVTPDYIEEQGYNTLDGNGNNPNGIGHVSARMIGTPASGPGSGATPKKPISNYAFKIHLVYTPLVTLHNPYNVPIEFERLRVSFRNVPVAMRFKVSGVNQHTQLVPFNRFSNGNRGGNATKNKAFGLNIESDRLLPGETKMYSAYINGMESWTNYAGGGSGDYTYDKWFADTGVAAFGAINRRQEFLTARPGWFGTQFGLDMDLMLGEGGMDYTSNNITDPINGQVYDRAGYITVMPDDEVQVEFAPLPNNQLTANDRNKFTVELRLLQPNEADFRYPERPLTSPCISVVEFDYAENSGAGTGLQRRLLNGGTLLSDSVAAKSYYAKWDKTLPTQNVYSFALFSAYAKTTHGGFQGNADGSYPAKPWMFGNHTAPVYLNDVVKTHPAHHSQEINLEKLSGNVDEKILSTGGGQTPFITGHTELTGRRFGSFHDIPLSPISSPVELNGANLGVVYTGIHFASPIGNGSAHPAMATDVSPLNGGDGKVDHSYMLNSILFDEFFYSGMQSRSSLSANSVISQYLNGNSDNVSDKRLQPFMADGESTNNILSQLTTQSENPYLKSACYSLLKGGFNVNSTSVDAWKAILSAMSGEGAEILHSESMQIENIKGLNDELGARFSRFRLPNGQFRDGDSYWQGYKDINRQELQSLAENIVSEVKARGPFLSVGEFINRQIGSKSNPSALHGVIQAAINQTSINQLTSADNAAEGKAPGYEIAENALENLEFPTGENLTGLSSQGAPGNLTQADVIKSMGNAINVRGDTFSIRAYGDAVDATGKIMAKAYCEAVVQRVPEFVDSSNKSYVSFDELNANNIEYGRKFVIRSFRWLGSDEI